jgi:hypothetical protein
MTDQDPPRLKTGGEAPDEVVRALRALGRDRDAARLARVAEQLGARIAASPSPSLLQKLSGSKIGMVGVVLGLGALGVLGYTLRAQRPAPAANVPAAHSFEVAAAPQELAAAPERYAAIEAVPSSPPTAATRRPLPRAARHAPRSRTAAPSPSAPAVVASVETADDPTPVEPTPAVAEPERPQPREKAKAKEAPVEPPAQASELTLLQDARKAVAEQPTAALQLLQEHSARFPKGMLTPEREMLTIEVLRKLGRSAEASQRLQQFEARYPRSIYLRRLRRGSSDDR